MLKSFEYYYNLIKEKFNYELTIFNFEYHIGQINEQNEIDDYLNVDCKNCTNCIMCIDCINCENCIDCKQCIKSKNCEGCYLLYKCENCNGRRRGRQAAWAAQVASRV